MKHRVSHTGGAGIGYGYLASFNYGWSLARLEATESGIILTVVWCKHYHFDKDMVSVRQYDGGFGLTGRGVQILHTKEAYPPFIVFWTFTPKRVLADLRRLGFAVRDGVARWRDTL